MAKENTQKLLEIFGLSLPFFGIPAYGCTNEKLVATISEQGALGVLQVGFKRPTEIEDSVRKIRKLTNKQFALLLHPPQKSILDTKKLELLNTAIAAIREELGLPLTPKIVNPDFEEQFQTICDLRIPVLGLQLGGLREPYMEKLEQNNIKTFGLASNLRDAKVLKSSGVDAVVLSGFSEPGLVSCNEVRGEKAKIDSICLMIEAVRAVSIPVLVASSILDKGQVDACKTIGIDGLVLSDAFLLSDESDIPEEWKASIPYLSDSASEVGKVFMGKDSRYLVNGLSEAIKENDLPILDFPYQFLALRDIFEVARRQKKLGLAFLEVGQLAYLARKLPAKSIINLFEQWWKGE